MLNPILSILKSICNIKLVAFIIFTSILLSSVFNISNASISKNDLGIALMILLITLFSDLKEFNFWGLTGKKIEKTLDELEGKKSIDESKEKPLQDDKVEEMQTNPDNILHLMETNLGNFLALTFEIEKLLRSAAAILDLKDIPSNINPYKITKELKDKGLLTENGVKQLEAIRWLRNIIVHGRSHEVSEKTLKDGINLAFNLYTELYNWLNSPN